MIKLTNRDYPNFHININGDQLEVIITLNVKPDMLPFLCPQHICKPKKHWVYVLRSHAPLIQMNEARVLSIANILINRAMIHCREAKQCALGKQMENIRTQTPRIISQN